MRNVIGSGEDLASPLDSKLLVGGSLVFLSLDGHQEAPKGFIPQRPRDASAGVAAGFKKHAPRLFVYVEPRLLALSRKRYALLADCYLAWGLKVCKSNGGVVVLGGVEREDGSAHVDVLILDNKRLVGVFDRELPPRASMAYQAAVDSVIADISTKAPGARIVQCGPMGSFGIPGVDYVGDKPLKAASYRPLTSSMSSRGDYLAPLVIGVGAIAAYCCAIGLGWGAYTAAVGRYDAALADPQLKGQGSLDASLLSVMTQRRVYMESPRRQDLLPEAAMKIVGGIAAVPNVKILELRLPAPSVNPQAQYGFTVIPTGQGNADLIGANRVPDAAMTISVPRARQGDAWEQAREVMTVISNQTGMSLRLVNNGVKEDGPRRQYIIEGFIHG